MKYLLIAEYFGSAGYSFGKRVWYVKDYAYSREEANKIMLRWFNDDYCKCFQNIGLVRANYPLQSRYNNGCFGYSDLDENNYFVMTDDDARDFCKSFNIILKY